MSEGHFCGPGCPECGEDHGCICGNDCLVEVDFHEMLTRVLHGEILTQDEATEVWSAMHQIIKESQVPQAGIILCLYDKLSRELHKGERCAVCGRYKNLDCILDC